MRAFGVVRRLVSRANGSGRSALRCVGWPIAGGAPGRAASRTRAGIRELGFGGLAVGGPGLACCGGPGTCLLGIRALGFRGWVLGSLAIALLGMGALGCAVGCARGASSLGVSSVDRGEGPRRGPRGSQSGVEARGAAEGERGARAAAGSANAAESGAVRRVQWVAARPHPLLIALPRAEEWRLGGARDGRWFVAEHPASGAVLSARAWPARATVSQAECRKELLLGQPELRRFTEGELVGERSGVGPSGFDGRVELYAESDERPVRSGSGGAGTAPGSDSTRGSDSTPGSDSAPGSDSTPREDSAERGAGWIVGAGPRRCFAVVVRVEVPARGEVLPRVRRSELIDRLRVFGDQVLGTVRWQTPEESRAPGRASPFAPEE